VRISMRGGRMVPVYRHLAYGDEFLALRPPESIRHFVETMEPGASRWILYGPGGNEVRGFLQQRLEQALIQPNRPIGEIVRLLEIDLERWLRRQEKGRGQ
jgi:hypothetical protein